MSKKKRKTKKTKEKIKEKFTLSREIWQGIIVVFLFITDTSSGIAVVFTLIFNY